MAAEQGQFTTALGLSRHWEVPGVRFKPERRRIDFEVGFAPMSRRLSWYWYRDGILFTGVFSPSTQALGP